ncbi:MAG TPA: hypothetical protein VJ110_01430, partial [Candidatus Nanoarchaeia archaeon]|nr:hypothetical protein [Candidatus Nanoarchaeia archaeon]
LVREGRVSRGSLVKIKNAQVKKGLKGDNEVHVNSRSSVIVTSQEEGGKEDYIKTCTVAELQDNVRASVIAEVVGLFEPKLYPTCPVCNKKVIPAVEGFLCAEHKKVTPGESMLLSFHLDDGTAVIRTVAFGKNAEKLCGLNITEIKSLGTEATESINAFLLGRTIRATGMARDNKNYARLEFAINDVDVEPNPKNLAMKMMEA